WIVKRLGISQEQASAAMERLLQLQLVMIDGRKFRASSYDLFAKNILPDEILKHFYQQKFAKALSAMESEDRSASTFSTLTMAVDVSRLDQAKTLVRRFQRELNNLMKSSSGDRVYTLGVQLFPLSKKLDS